MKKVSYLILPAIFLSICAVSVFAQNNKPATNKESKTPATTINVLSKEEFDNMNKEMERIKQEMEATRQQIEAQKNTLESMTINSNINMAQVEKDLALLLNAKGIKAGEKIDLQNILFTNNEEKPETKYYKLKLDENAQYVLLDPKTSKESKEPVSWVWNDFLGKYEYEFNFRLIFPQTEQAHLLIKITPVLSKDKEPTLPVIHIAFNFNEKGDITYGGHVRAIDGHEGFESKLAIRVK